MKVECVYTVLKSSIIEVDDKYRLLITNSDRDLETKLFREAYDAIEKSEGDFVKLSGIFEAGTNACLVEQ